MSNVSNATVSATVSDHQAAFDWLDLWAECGGEDTLETFVRDLITEPRQVQDALFSLVDLQIARSGSDPNRELMLVEALKDEIERRHQAATWC